MTAKVLNVRSMVTDIRQGLKESVVLSKYALTTRQLERLLNSMLKAGHLTDMEVLNWLKLTDSQLMRAFRDDTSNGKDR